MRVVIPGGEVFDLGTTETTPTVGIIDYSKRSTDDFGVTTVVERGFARRMSVRLGVPIELADSVLRKLAALRASTAQWVANDNYACLAVNGFLKDFDLDFSSPPLSYCTLTVEGLTETEPFVDAGGDPAPFGQTSTLRLLQPALIAGSALVSSNVVENDYATWAAGATYALGDRVINTTTHRIYESAVPGNIGNDPTAATGKWSDIGPTNRWAMFDQALGSTTEQAGSIAVTVDAATINAVALLDVIGATVRVQATGYDKTLPVGAGAITFLDLPAGLTRAAVTITGSGTVSVGTLLVGKLVGLGVTEASPTAGITDYSRKEFDEFGEPTVVPRAWAKRMTTNALISTSAIDSVFSRIAAVRATPSLWIGQAGFDSLTIYGFFKEFLIEAGDTVSKLSLSIEGLSTAGKVEPFAPGGGGTNVNWEDVGDPTGTKPANNATNGRDPNSPLGSTTVGALEAAFAAARAQLAYIDGTTIPTINTAVAGANTRIDTARQDANSALAQAVALLNDKDAFLNTRIDSVSASGGYNDTAVYAEVRRVDQAAISRDGTIGQRIDSVITNYQTADTNTNARVEQVATSASNATTAVADLTTSVNTRFSGVNTTLSSYDQRITALADGSLSYVGRTDVLEARAGNTSNYATSNANFTAWPDGSALPSQWAYWHNNGTFTREGGNLQAGAYMLGHVAPADVDSGINTVFFVTAGYWVIEASAWIEKGSAQGAGAYIDNLPGLDFSTTPDITGYVGVGLGVRHWSLLVKSEFAGPTNLYAMSNWGSFGARAAKTIHWMKCGARPATDGEIKAQKADIALPLIAARVKTTEDAIVDLPNQYAAASRTATLEAQVQGTANSNLLARANSQTAAIVDSKVGAITQDVSTLRSEYNGTVATVQQQAGTLAGIDGRSSVYWRVSGTTPDGGTFVQLSKADGSPGLFYVNANMVIDGSLLVTGTVNTVKISPNAITQWAAINNGSGVVQDGGPIASGTASMTTQGGIVKIDFSFDATSTEGTGASFYYQLFRDNQPITRKFNVLTTTISGYVNLSVSTDMPPPGFHFYNIEVGRLRAGTSELQVSSIAIFIQEFKR